MGAILPQVAGRTDVQLDKARALVSTNYADVFIPTTGLGTVHFRIDHIGTIVKRSSVTVTERETTATVTATEDGKTVLSAEVDKATGTALSGWSIKNGVQTDLKGWKPVPNMKRDANITSTLWDFLTCFNNCLASAGIAAWVVAIIEMVCSSVCVGTMGTGCILCLSASTLVAGSTLSYCVGRAMREVGWAG